MCHLLLSLIGSGGATSGRIPPILLLPIKAASVNMQEKIVFVIFDGKLR